MSSFNRFTAWFVVGLCLIAARDLAPDGSLAEMCLGMALGSAVVGALSSASEKEKADDDSR